MAYIQSLSWKMYHYSVKCFIRRNCRFYSNSNTLNFISFIIICAYFSDGIEYRKNERNFFSQILFIYGLDLFTPYEYIINAKQKNNIFLSIKHGIKKWWSDLSRKLFMPWLRICWYSIKASYKYLNIPPMKGKYHPHNLKLFIKFRLKLQLLMCNFLDCDISGWFAVLQKHVGSSLLGNVVSFWVVSNFIIDHK